MEQHQVDLIGTNVVARCAAPKPRDCVAPRGGAGEAECLLVFVPGARIHELLQCASSYSSTPCHGDGSHLFFLLQITRKMHHWKGVFTVPPTASSSGSCCASGGTSVPLSSAARRAERERRRRASVGLREGVLKVKGQANLTIDAKDKLLLQLERRDAERAKTSSAAPPTRRVVAAPAVRPR
uniref:Uncharacterized protein n=1 Tax=Oryza glumipatula TaxID=40148 RepID=A0A0E0B0V8_9ORYZ